jgi:hypothetical protein
VWGIPVVLPYIIDRLLAHRLSGLTASLVFPTAWVATEYVREGRMGRGDRLHIRSTATWRYSRSSVCLTATVLVHRQKTQAIEKKPIVYKIEQTPFSWPF